MQRISTARWLPARLSPCLSRPCATLNFVANPVRKPYQEIFTEFEENYVPDSRDGDGDVKYHLGFSSDRVSNGKTIHISLSPNPSHLEAVDPVVEGRTRAKQF